MQMPPKVSIVVPCYNKEEYIDAMLESVHKQVWDNIELILVNDGSTDRTREIIAQWQPKLVQRGFDVVIIDQANAGVWAAVKTGLERASGEYICSVDCDDMIKPDFIFIQASFLSQNSEYDWTIVSTVVREKEDTSIEETLARTEQESSWELPLALENYVLSIVYNAVWCHMVRKSYLVRCHVLEAFNLAPQATQEPCFMLPLIAGGGKIKFLPDAVYIYNAFASEHCSPRTFEKGWKYYKNASRDYELVLNNLAFHPKRIKYLAFLARAAQLKWISLNLEKIRLNPNEKEQLFAEWAEIASIFFGVHFVPPPCAKVDFNDFYMTIFNAIAWSATATDKTLIKLQERGAYRDIICYGALGKRADTQLAAIKKSQLFPNKFWDISTSEEDFLYGYKVNKPKFDDLCKDDLIVVFPKQESIYSYVLEKAEMSKAKVIRISDLRIFTEIIDKLVKFGINKKAVETALFSAKSGDD